MTEIEAIKELECAVIDANAYDVCKKALEKQIAKKPVKENGDCIALSRDGKETFEIIHRCPACNSRDLIFGYPCKCGQKLDWGNEEMIGLINALQTIKAECENYKYCDEGCPLYDGYECIVQKDNPEQYDLTKFRGE